MYQILLPHIILSIGYFFIGTVLGSFANVLILRYGHGPITGRSICPHCKKQLSAWDLVPMLSYLFLGGKCRNCQAAISIQYPLVEFIGGLAAVFLLQPLTLFSLASTITGILSLLIVVTLMILFVIDLRTMLLPDVYVVSLGILVAVRLIFTAQSLLLAPIILGIIVGAGSLALLWLVTRGRGLGLGDVKLMIPLGALFGHIETMLLLLAAFIAGGAIASVLLLTKKATMKTAVPFGPFLTGTAILFILWSDLPLYLINLLFGYSLRI